MKKLFKRFRKGQKGFTLIELLIVVAILGILMAVVIPNIAKFMESGEKAGAQAELSTVQTAVFAYMADAGLSTITAGTIYATSTTLGDLVAPFLGSGLDKLKGSWDAGDDGYITDGTYPVVPGWTYDASIAPPGDWVHT